MPFDPCLTPLQRVDLEKYVRQARVHPSTVFPCRDRSYPIVPTKEAHLNTILIVVLVLLLIGALPTWPYSTNWGYYPSGGLGLVLLILLILALTGRLS